MQKTIDNFLKNNNDDKKIRFVYSISKNTFIDACVQIATNSCRPFTIFEDSGFQTITSQIQKELNLKITRKNIGIFIKEKLKF